MGGLCRAGARTRRVPLNGSRFVSSTTLISHCVPISQASPGDSQQDPRHRLFEDIQHSTRREARYILYGRSLEARVVTVGFTRRGRKIRVIAARAASRKERRIV